MDVLKFSDSLPKLEPIIQRIDQENYQRIRDLQSNFQSRAVGQSYNQYPPTSLPLVYSPSSRIQQELQPDSRTPKGSVISITHQKTSMASSSSHLPSVHHHDTHNQYHHSQPQLPFFTPRYGSFDNVNESDDDQSSINGSSRNPEGLGKIRSGSFVDPLSSVPLAANTSDTLPAPGAPFMDRSGSGRYNPLTQRNSSVLSDMKLESTYLQHSDRPRESSTSSRIFNSPYTSSPRFHQPQEAVETESQTHSPAPPPPPHIGHAAPLPQHIYGANFGSSRGEIKALLEKFRRSEPGPSRPTSLLLLLLAFDSTDNSKKSSLSHITDMPNRPQIRNSIIALHKYDSANGSHGSSVDSGRDSSGPVNVSSLSSGSSTGSLFSPSSSISSVGSIRNSMGSVSSISHLLNLRPDYKPAVKSSLSKESATPEPMVKEDHHHHHNQQRQSTLSPGQQYHNLLTVPNGSNFESSALSTVVENSPGSAASSSRLLPMNFGSNDQHSAFSSKSATPLLTPLPKEDEGAEGTNDAFIGTHSVSNVDLSKGKKVLSVSSLLDTSPKTVSESNIQSSSLFEKEGAGKEGQHYDNDDNQDKEDQMEDSNSRKRVYSGSSTSNSSEEGGTNDKNDPLSNAGASLSALNARNDGIKGIGAGAGNDQSKNEGFLQLKKSSEKVEDKKRSKV